MKNYTRDTFDKLLTDIKKEINELSNSTLEHTASDIKDEIEQKHHNAYSVDVEKTAKGIDIFSRDEKALQMEYGTDVPAWRSTFAEYKSKTGSNIHTLKSKGFKV